MKKNLFPHPCIECLQSSYPLFAQKKDPLFAQKKEKQ